MSSQPSSFKPLTKEDVAEILRISVRTVENWTNDGLLVPPAKLGGRVFWHPEIFFDWLSKRLREPADGAEEKLLVAPKARLRKSAESYVDGLRARGENKLRRMLSD